MPIVDGICFRDLEPVPYSRKRSMGYRIYVG